MNAIKIFIQEVEDIKKRNFMEKYLEMKKKAYHHLWAQRILTEMGYLFKIMEAENREIPLILKNTEDWLYEQYQQEGCITAESAQEAERRMVELQQDAKKYKIIFAGHAHIDMNWMWGYQETVNLTIDTFQTMLNLMEEYPKFTFSQSQASVYEIIEKYCPSMLPEIRQRVQEGRWEVTASTWVEPDKNMSGTESMVRHILYTKQYLSQLLGISSDSMELDFEPDTFGHSSCVPEILSQGGIKYYYHCRGFEDYTLYRWKAPSGQEVLVNRDSAWYLGPVEYERVLYLPGYSKKNHFNTLLYVYGVGDHGGGPTRRDIKRILEMQEWPLMPNVHFGTMQEFFKEAEKEKEHFPIVDHELNFVFTGCYTTQSRIKMANRTGEDRLYDGEMLGAVGKMVTENSSVFWNLEAAWRKILFNQFHDILPGSGVVETREYAMGQFQTAMSYCGANVNRAMKAIGERINTKVFGESFDEKSRSEGAGVGYGTGITTGQWGNAGSSEFGFTQTHRGNGDIRVYTLYNTTQYDRKEIAVITLWDWEFSEKEIMIFDYANKEVPMQILEQGTHYWQHQYIKIAFWAEVPAFGYQTYAVKRKKTDFEFLRPFADPRVHRMEDGIIVLENEEIEGVFDSQTMKLVSLKDKKTGKEMLNNPSGYFRLIEEDDVQGMTAWVVGNYTRVVDLNETEAVRIIEKNLQGLRKWIIYEMDFLQSSVKTKVLLDKGSKMLRYEVTVDWQEIGKKGKYIPQLQFYMPVGYAVKEYLYDIPEGCQRRPELGHDVPGIYFAAAVSKEDSNSIFLTSNCKYGYRGWKQSLTMNLLRGAYDPDLYPDLGIHSISIGVGIERENSWENYTQEGFLFNHPLYPYSNTIHEGDKPLSYAFMKVEGAVKVSAWKLGEEQRKSWIIRLYHHNNSVENAVLFVDEIVESAELTDLLERKEEDLQVCDINEKQEKSFWKQKICVQIPPYSMRTVKIVFS